MAATLHHRGPDDRGEWADARHGIALGFRRLSIIDLSPHGAQPRTSSCGRYVLIFNGELYNFRELRRTLENEGRTFRGSSDTEVLIEAISEWGFETALAKSNGMFAFAVWDRDDETLRLARDRMGEKPLYYGWHGQHFFFASETRALRAHPDFDASIDPDAVHLFLRHNYIPAPWSIHEGIRKLPPGTYIEVRGDGREPEAIPYWSLKEAVEAGLREPLNVGRDEGVRALEQLLLESVALRMVADVPLGAFLSGGLDSTTVVALMQKSSSKTIRTFSVGFHDEAHDEAADAAAVARHLGTDHTEMYVGEDALLESVPRMAEIYDEPFADSSQIPTHMVSRLAREHVTVALSGDGGDELFGGYPRYVFADRYWRRSRLLPASLRGLAAKGVKAISAERWDGALGRLGLSSDRLGSRPGDRLHKFADVLGATSDARMIARLNSFWEPRPPVLTAEPPLSPWEDPHHWASTQSIVEQMMQLDAAIYLPDDILAKVDRASMAVSLETRIPLLDHRLVELAWRMPLKWKFDGQTTKVVLRDIVYRHVPREIVDRPKMGFGVPLAAWLRGPLRDWAGDLLAPNRVQATGLLDSASVTQRWEEHSSGRRDWKYDLWGAVMLMAWVDAVDRERADRSPADRRAS